MKLTQFQLRLLVLSKCEKVPNAKELGLKTADIFYEDMNIFDVVNVVHPEIQKICDILSPGTTYSYNDNVFRDMFKGLTSLTHKHTVHFIPRSDDTYTVEQILENVISQGLNALRFTTLGDFKEDFAIERKRCIEEGIIRCLSD